MTGNSAPVAMMCCERTRFFYRNRCPWSILAIDGVSCEIACGTSRQLPCCTLWNRPCTDTVSACRAFSYGSSDGRYKK